MAKPRTLSQSKEPRWYSGADVPMSAIRRFARQITERFNPEKIILFGSYAYGKPNEGSDVDILVVMSKTRNDQARKIRESIVPPFFPQVVVRSSQELRDWLVDGDPFHIDMVTKGITLYEKGNERLGRKSRRRLPRSRSPKQASRAAV
jgi:uncharacterized protein